ETQLATAYSTWQTQAKDLWDVGGWQPNMPEVGGRYDIGHMPEWTVWWLYTGDYRMHEYAFKQADLAAAWSAQFREGNSTKFFDLAQTTPAIGRPISLFARPTLSLRDDMTPGVPGDALNYINRSLYPSGYPNYGGWNYQNAHMPDPYMAQY